MKETKKKTRISPFSICDQTLMYADRVVIPHSLQKTILKEFHTRYPGMSRMNSLPRSYTYWPCMDQDIEKIIKKMPLRLKLDPGQKTDVPWTRHVCRTIEWILLIDPYR